MATLSIDEATSASACGLGIDERYLISSNVWLGGPERGE